MTAPSLVQFLLARIAEDEKAAGAADALGQISDRITTSECEEFADHIARWHPARVMAECEAKRRIVEDHRWVGLPEHHRRSKDAEQFPDRCRRCWDGPGFVAWPCPTMRALAMPYADHPDFNPEWRP